MIRIERTLSIEDKEERRVLWEFYDGVFRDVNKRTPIRQSWPRDSFMRWLRNGKVVKFVAYEGDDEARKIVGLGVVAEQLRVDPLLSPWFFAENFPDRPVYYCPVLAVAPNHRRNSVVAAKLLQAMFGEVPENGIAVSLNSHKTNVGIPRLAQMAMHGHIKGQEMDAEGCTIYEWTKNNGGGKFAT